MRYPLALALCGLSALAWADEVKPAASAPTWAVSTGVGAAWTPEVMGGRYDHVRWLGQVSAVRDDGWFVDTRDGMGKAWQLAPNWSLALLLAASDRRAQSSRIDHDTSLEGMGDIGATAQAGALLRYQQGDWKLGAKYLSNLKGGMQGQQLALSVDYTLLTRPSAVLVLNSALMAGDRHYMQRWFGVNAEQAANTSFSAYQAGGGWSQGVVGLTLLVPIDKHWQVIGRAAYLRMLGSSQDSPLVKTHGYGAGGGLVQYNW
ncbi:MipA/OmpV family protein [Paludibacterium sp.]|uniref:MipA/OmpV family protein n=1 Tax=Paludibacterium sp. TaxID=1917523 RepID=UPI0025D73AA1|nr:MipA/OmpV family protein [Paludibacterium sp.]MBV8648782.1 MipA/OmpV family protein [Paludibacterium sp.]